MDSSNLLQYIIACLTHTAPLKVAMCGVLHSVPQDQYIQPLRSSSRTTGSAYMYKHASILRIFCSSSCNYKMNVQSTLSRSRCGETQVWPRSIIDNQKSSSRSWIISISQLMEQVLRKFLGGSTIYVQCYVGILYVIFINSPVRIMAQQMPTWSTSLRFYSVVFPQSIPYPSRSVQCDAQCVNIETFCSSILLHNLQN